jgi:energy-coupling factor transporter ATP-binding protein EcfA2
MPRKQNGAHQIKLARDARSGATITLDLSLPRAIFVTGKRGSGKTAILKGLKGVRDPGQAIIVDDTAERALLGVWRSIALTDGIRSMRGSPVFFVCRVCAEHGGKYNIEAS